MFISILWLAWVFAADQCAKGVWLASDADVGLKPRGCNDSKRA